MNDAAAKPDDQQAPRGGGTGERPPRGLLRRAVCAACWTAVAGAAGVVMFAWGWPVAEAPLARPLELAYAAAFVVRTLAAYGAIATVLLAGVCFACRVWRAGVLALALGAFLAKPTVLDLLPNSAKPVAAGEDTLIVYSSNVWLGRADPAVLRESIERSAAEVVVLQEVTPEFVARARRAGLFEGFAHVHLDTRTHSFGQAVLSKRPFVGDPGIIEAMTKPATWGPWERADPQTRLRVPFAGGELAIVNVHLANPMAARRIVRQGGQVHALLAWLRAEGHLESAESDGKATGTPALVIGDLNCTPSSAHATLLRHAGLTDAHRVAGRGLSETHPGSPRLAPYTFGFRIDHAYTTPGLRAVGFETLDVEIGSDHKPIVVTVAMPDQTASP